MHSKPLSVSFIIPNYNGSQLLEANLPAVIKAAQKAEIIVVDDASTDNSIKLVTTKFPHVKVIPLKKNHRFAIACNTGVMQASGDIIVLLNTDVVPELNFLKPLLAPFKDPNVFAVGCAEINTGHRLSGRACGFFHRGFLIHQKCANQPLSHTLWASGGSAAFRQSMWQELGGFDPLFSPAYQEDRDICYRALKRGWQIMFAPQSRVHHHHK